MKDIKFAARMLLANKAVSAVAVLTFALGIGVNTAVFSVFNGVLLRPLAYPEPDRITMVWLDNRRQAIREDITSYPNYRDWRDQNSSYAHLAAFSRTSFSLTGVDEPERLIGAEVTANFFDVLGLRPLMGRVFTAAQETSGNDAVVVLSHGLWQRRFGGAGDVIGRTITLSGRAHEVIGVMPRELQEPDDVEFWKPLAPGEQDREARGAFWLPVIGRLKPGVSVEQAQADMANISARLERDFPSNRGYGAYVVSLHTQKVGDIERSLVVLLAAVGFVLLIACANLGNLMLGRTAARRKELAIRTALGARRARLIRQIVTETFLLALAGSAIGLVLAYWVTGFFIALGGASIPRPETIGIDARVLGFAIGLAVVSALLAGLIPALQASRPALVEHLREGGREGGAPVSRRTRNTLVALEVALAFVLLAGAGVLMRTLWSMQSVDRGFSTERVAKVTVSLPATLYAGGPDVRTFYARLLERVRALPGVESAALGTGVLQPMVARSGTFTIEGRPQPPQEEQIEYPFEMVSPGYFETLGVRIAHGRVFTDRDGADAPQAVVINETLARLGWPGQDAVGRRIKRGGEASTAPWMTVVGVIEDMRRADVRGSIRPELYMSALQVTPRTQTLYVRTAGAPGAIIGSIRRELQALNPQLPLFNTGVLADDFAETLTSPRFRAVLLAAFALIALMLATVGIYGVTSHAVSQRTHEVGVRMALGAHRRDVLRLMLGQHLRPALAGVLIGLISAIALSRYLETLVYGVRAADPLTFVLMAVALIGVAALACWIPARRATRVDPLIALRAE